MLAAPFPGMLQPVWLEQAQSWAGHLQGGLSVLGEVTSLGRSHPWRCHILLMSHPGEVSAPADGAGAGRSCQMLWGTAALPHLAVVVRHGEGICSCSSGCSSPHSLCCGLMVGWQLCLISVAAAASGLYQQHSRHRSLATLAAPSPGCTSRGSLVKDKVPAGP